MKTLLKPAIDKKSTAEMVRPLVKKEKRTKQIRITERTYDELIKLGNMADDFEDVIARLLKEHRDKSHD